MIIFSYSPVSRFLMTYKKTSLRISKNSIRWKENVDTISPKQLEGKLHIVKTSSHPNFGLLSFLCLIGTCTFSTSWRIIVLHIRDCEWTVSGRAYNTGFGLPYFWLRVTNWTGITELLTHFILTEKSKQNILSAQYRSSKAPMTSGLTPSVKNHFTIIER